MITIQLTCFICLVMLYCVISHLVSHLPHPAPLFLLILSVFLNINTTTTLPRSFNSETLWRSLSLMFLSFSSRLLILLYLLLVIFPFVCLILFRIFLSSRTQTSSFSLLSFHFFFHLIRLPYYC